MKRIILLLAVLILFFPVVHAGTISISTEYTTTATPNGTIIFHLATTNRGTATAYNVRSIITFAHRSYEGSYATILPSAKETGDIAVPFPDTAQGTFPLIITTEYDDAYGRPSSTKTASIFEIAKASLAEITGTIQFKKDTRGQFTLTIQNTGDTTQKIQVTAYAHPPLQITPQKTALVLDGRAQQTLSFSAPTPNNKDTQHTLSIFIEYDSNQTHYTTLVPGSFTVKKQELPMTAIIFLFSVAALAITLAALFFKIPQWVINTAFLCLITLFLLSYIKPSLLFLQTTTTGGDTASHYYTAYYLKAHLLPLGKISGWTFGNLAGFPLLQFYFPLPFLLIALLGYLIPLQIAFKIITVLGTFLLPVTVYFGLKKLDFDFPAPILGAIFTLPFLFNEANSMWGGNIPSTLAGEFSESLSMALALLWYGFLYAGITKKKYMGINILLFCLMILSHLYPAFIVVFSSPLLLLHKEWKFRFWYLFKMYALSTLLVLWWLFPWLRNIPWTESHNFTWNFTSGWEAFPKILIPFFVLGILGIIALIRDEKNKTHLDKILYCIIPIPLAVFLYTIAHYIGLVDIRFIPFIYLWLCIFAAQGVVFLVRHGLGHIGTDFLQTVHRALVGIFFIVVILLVFKSVTFIPYWLQWNYDGFEHKENWPTYQAINEFLDGDFNEPRVVYEHSQLHNTFGTERAFENLPLFSGRATLEGVYLQSAVTAPYIFYIQSEISQQQSCPFWHKFPCTSMNFKKAAKHLKLFNVKHLIIISPQAQKAIAERPEYTLVKEIKNYQIYQLTSASGKNNNGYVTPLLYEPVAVQASAWKNISYTWFTQSDLDTHLVFLPKVTDKEKSRFHTILQPQELDVHNLPKKQLRPNCIVNATLSDAEIAINTTCINTPLLIKVSYHPSWKVEGADTIYLASPGFMLIYPLRENVKLYYR